MRLNFSVAALSIKSVMLAASIFGLASIPASIRRALADGPPIVNYGAIGDQYTTSVGIINSDSIPELTNYGSIESKTLSISNSGEGMIKSLSNFGQIYGGTAIQNDGTINSLINGTEKSRSVIYGLYQYGILNTGKIEIINNYQEIAARLNGIYNTSTGSVGAIHNFSTGSITASTGEPSEIFSNGIVNEGSIRNFQNDVGGYIFGFAHGIVNGSNGFRGTIESITNAGSIYGYKGYAIWNQSSSSNPLLFSIGNIENSSTGQIIGEQGGIQNESSIGTLINHGLIYASKDAGISNGSNGVSSSIQLISNYGEINGEWSGIRNRAADVSGSQNVISRIENFTTGYINGGRDGIRNDALVELIANGGLITGNNGVANTGTLQEVSNAGEIQGFESGIANYYDGRSSRISLVTNFGSISNGRYGIQNIILDLTSFNDVLVIPDLVKSMINIDQIVNSSTGYIYGHWAGIRNDATIGSILNYGEISSRLSGSGIYNTGVIGSLVNAQGGSSIQPLTFKGNLPSSYYIYIASASHYGQISFTNGSGVMNVGVELADGVRPVNLYSSVISGVDASHLGNTTGTVNGWNWRLEQVGLAWNLIFVGPNVYDTYADLSRSANNIRNTIALRSSSIALMMDYDCRAFAQYNTCISFGGRYSDLNASTNEGAGILTAAYRVSPSVRIGAFIDHRVTQSKPAGINYSDDTPSVGAFIGYDDHGDGTGAQGKVTAVYNTGKVGVTRQVSSANTEAGSGSSRLTLYAVGAELGWGIQLNDGWVGTPYAGIRQTSSKLVSYAEQLTDSVKFPISYADYGQRLTTATAGGRIDGRMTERVSIALAAGIERDLRSTMDAYAGTSDIPGLASFSFSTSVNSNRSRAVGSAALSYQIEANQRVSAGVSVRENAYVSQPTRTMQMKYEMAF